MTDETSTIVSKFENLGTDEPVGDSEGARATIMEICKTYPDKFFTQKEFRENLDTMSHDGKTGFSNPYINSILKKLVEEGTLSKQKSGRNAYYRWSGE